MTGWSWVCRISDTPRRRDSHYSFWQTEHNDIGRSPDQGSVSAQAGAQSQAPPYRPQLSTADGVTDDLYNRDKCRHKRDIVQNPGEYPRGEEQHKAGFLQIPSCQSDHPVCQRSYNTGIFQNPHHNEEPHEKTESYPIRTFLRRSSRSSSDQTISTQAPARAIILGSSSIKP